MKSNESIILKRDCNAILIPVGDKIVLKAGEPVTITQALGGSFTVYIHGNLARIDARDGDALGKGASFPRPSPPEEEREKTSRASVKPHDDSCSGDSATESHPLDEEAVWEQLRMCYDPEIPVNIVDLGLVYDLQISPLSAGGNRVEVKMTLTAPGCGMGPILQQDVEDKVRSIPGVREAAVYLVWDPPWNREMISEAARLQLGLM
jgi:metal-sulfur cluster biosynthetic enzyme